MTAKKLSEKQRVHRAVDRAYTRGRHHVYCAWKEGKNCSLVDEVLKALHPGVLK